MLRPILRTAARPSVGSFLVRAHRAPLVRPTTLSFPCRRSYADEAVEDARGPPVAVEEMAEKKKVEEVIKEDFGGDEEIDQVSHKAVFPGRWIHRLWGRE